MVKAVSVTTNKSYIKKKYLNLILKAVKKLLITVLSKSVLNLGTFKNKSFGNIRSTARRNDESNWYPRDIVASSNKVMDGVDEINTFAGFSGEELHLICVN